MQDARWTLWFLWSTSLFLLTLFLIDQQALVALSLVALYTLPLLSLLWLPGRRQLFVIAVAGALLGLADPFLSPPGTPLWASITNRVLVVGTLCGTVFLVGKRKQAEEALRQSEERWRLAAWDANVGIWDWDGQTNTVRFGGRWYEMLGFTEEELGSRFDTVWTQHVHPDDLPRVRALLEAHLTNQKDVYEAEYRMRCKDGGEKWLSSRGQAVRDATGKAVRMVGSYADITARKQAEEALRQSEEHWQLAAWDAKAGTWDWDMQTDTVRFGGRWHGLLGFTVDELGTTLDAAWARHVHPDDLPRVRSFLREHFAKRSDVVEVEYRVRCKNDSEKWIAARGQLMWGGAGKVVRLVGSYMDITARKEAEIARQRLSRQLLEVQEAERRAIARDLHDEVMQTLTALQMNLDLVATSLPAMPERLTESMALVDDLMDQVRTLSLNLRPTVLDELGLVAALDWYCRQQTSRFGVRAHLVSDPALRRLNSEIETACFRVAQEAMTNVVKHAHAQEVWVSLRQEKGELRLTVQDNGVGFNVAVCRQHAAQSSGLGLRGMEERLRLIGGQLDICSRLGHGTEIRARVPLDERMTAPMADLMERDADAVNSSAVG
jgi:PAS domain S-box-containing protein